MTLSYSYFEVYSSFLPFFLFCEHLQRQAFGIKFLVKAQDQVPVSL